MLGEWVDFHWEVDGKMYDFSMPGGGFVSFYKLVEVLGIVGDTNKSGNQTRNASNNDENDTILTENKDDENVNLAEEVSVVDNQETTVLTLESVVVSDATREFVADVESVVFSSPELVDVSKVESETTVGGIKESRGLECVYSSDLSNEQIEEINETIVSSGDWALISVLPFDSEESLTITMKTGEVFTIRVTDAQASDPYGLDRQTFVIANSNQAMRSSLNSGSLESGSVSNATTDAYKWRVDFDKDAFNGAGGYYLVNSSGKYVKVDNGTISFTDKETTVTVNIDGENVEQKIILATPFKVSFDATATGDNSSINQGKERGAYRFSTDSNGNSGFLTYSNNRFAITNTNNSKTWMLLRNPESPASTPGTVGTWDIVSDEIELKLFDYSGTVTQEVDDWNNGWWEQWPQYRWYIDWSRTDLEWQTINGQYGPWVTGEYHPGKKNETKDIDAVWGSNTSETELRAGTGVNAGRTIVFSGSGLSGQSGYNNFTGSNTDGTGGYYSGYVYQNIVKHNLGTDDYPQLAVTIPSDATADTADGGSLGYLFGSKNSQDGEAVGGVTSYTNGGNGLKGLLRKDADGYYYYDSEDNYARLNANDGSADEVLLYSDTYNKDAGSSNVKKQKIGFFPFTDMDTSDGEEKGPAKVSAGGDLYYDHQFGMSLETQFIYPHNGIVPDTNKQMIFDFSGDDDVWVFVDGVLLLDLGGVHQPIHGTINFATGDIDIYEYNSSGVETKSSKSTTISAMFAAASAESGETKTFDNSDFSSHKLSFFYLERGGCDSNLAIKFNLLVNKSLTVAKRLNGLTPAERQKYLNDMFLYELALRHNANWNDSGVDIDLDDEAAVWENASRWRIGFEAYNTAFATKNETGNYTQHTKSDGTIEKGVPIQNGQIYLKANESMMINRLPRTDIFYLAEEDRLDMDQFETPHAERLYVDASDSSKHEEEVHLHEDNALVGNTADWETKPYALMDTERVVYTNTLQEKNLDVEKIWSDGKNNHTRDEVKFQLHATVMDGSASGTDYATFMQSYNSAHGTSYSNNINAQWTVTTTSGASTQTGDILNREYTLNTANDWKLSFEHLPKKTQDPEGSGKEIIYTLEEVSVKDGYSSTISPTKNADKVYLDIFKFWPDSNDNHRDDKAESFTVRITDSLGNTIKATKDTNGEWKYNPTSGTTDITFGPTSTDDMFDYAARINNLPRYDSNGNEITYTFTQVGDNDTTTTGLVMFTRPAEIIEIKNDTAQITVEKKWVDVEGKTLASHPEEILFDVYRYHHEHKWGAWTTVTPATSSSEGSETRTCEQCNATETRTIDAGGHDFKFQKSIYPTCTSEGYDLYVCTNNPEHIERRNITDALGHSWGTSVVKVAATCTTDGLREYTCTRTGCAGILTENIPATGHTWSSWSLDEKGEETDPLIMSRECSVCHEKEIQEIDSEEEVQTANEQDEVGSQNEGGSEEEHNNDTSPIQYLPESLRSLHNPSKGDYVEIYRYSEALPTVKDGDTQVGTGDTAYWSKPYRYPKYDENGNEYAYYVVETSPASGYKTSYAYFTGVYDTSSGTVDYNATTEEAIHNHGKVVITNKETVEITVYKVDDKGKGLAGATFKLTKGDHDTLVPVKKPGQEIENVIVTVEPLDSNETVTISNGNASFVIPEHGVKISGLTNTTYKLTEISSPSGYVITNADTAFRVEGGKLYQGNKKIESLSFTIVNTPGAALPNTGGPGTTLIYLFGIMLTGLAGAGLVIKRRRRNAA